MPRARPLFLLLFVLFAWLPATAGAAPRDAAAKRKIDEAINKHYLVTDFDKAESVLLGVIAACGGKCSKPVLARAWVYVGIVRGSGRNDPRGAKKAFVTALGMDRRIVLDAALATKKTKKLFEEAKRSAGSGGGDEPDEGLGDAEPTGAGSMDCSPKVSAVQTRRPIPVQCGVGEQTQRVDLKYKSSGKGWKEIRMKKKRGGSFQATIPCGSTQRTGAVQFYVRGLDAEGDIVESYGSKREPLSIEVVRDADEEPPAFPEQDPPRRCSRASDEERTSCESSEDCESGMTCVRGSCEQAQSCEHHDECPAGNKCIDGTCQGKTSRANGPFKKSWFGFHVAYDFTVVGGDAVCSQESQRDSGFACFYKDTEEQYSFQPNKDSLNTISTGLAPATVRALLSFDQVFGANVSAGARVGYAFGGGPPSGAKDAVSFFPYHIELRATYWFGQSPFSEVGFRPYLGLQAGAAQVDAKIPVKVADCAGTATTPSKAGAQVAEDFGYYQACQAGNQPGVELDLDAYKKLGKVFGGIHGGFVYAISADSGIQLNVNVMQMLPTSGQAFEPSLGFVQGI